MKASGTVLITGANSGIGLATALAAAGRGFNVIGTVRTEDKADVLRKAAADAGVPVDVRFLEATDAAACADVLADLDDLYGLVNNAGYNATGAIEDMTDAEAEHCLHTMAIAPMRLARLAVPLMRARGGGRIVHVASVNARSEMPLVGWYSAAKQALEAASASMSMEVAADGITISCIEPGGVRTGIWREGVWDEDAFPGSRYEKSYGRLRSFIELNDRFVMAEPEKVARVICRVLMAKRPRRHYLVGRDAWSLAATQNLLPRPIRERVYRKVFSL